MASTAAALNTALLTAVYVVLLHSSMGEQPTPMPHCPDHTGHQPAPAPTPTPAPAPSPPPMPTPAPAPAVSCPEYCSSQCYANCTAYRQNGLARCDADNVAAFNSCYGSCTAQSCPGKSCVHSGCGYGYCTCENTNASTCCQDCGRAISRDYNNCRTSIERGMYYCMLSCTGDCDKNCPQG